ncbi:Sodium/potassium/calcium exchanger 1 [Wickerhamomyces ciferrii]|uniref:Sodium/potassium/calcium exchanger 1 n=1 Tax=Wickerhamomyces ciferrii (strain ATCC 14091 / BCRC 22168 / CBS 111 / JCM 3599 / NBRC 0793 / NRRL Y-1031 F-60-10) TaxID=1206466 RepID=K0KX89_WICCF|nr:Sodium/potassium/calcium exchanger 1 [Wickerhamomyces ciferrii]CCH46099.1 Sodium/potassium/calcium exchanger 1 [Wickerhamomyces ciferrii]
MSENLAGVTFLALGNGSPDVFSTLEAMKIGSSNLAIGELCGAALFITCVVVGGMSIVKPFKVVKKPFIRDLIFLILAIIITMIFLSDGKITIWESLIMLLLYVIYVVFVISWGWLTTKKRKQALIDQKIRNNYYNGSSQSMAQYQIDEDQEVNDEDILNGLGSMPGIEALDHIETTTEDLNEYKESHSLIRPSILGALEFNNQMQNYFEDREGTIRLDDNDDQIHNTNISLNPLPSRLKTSPTSPFIDHDDEYSTDRYQTAPAMFIDHEYRNLDNLEFLESQPDFDNVHQIIKTRLKKIFNNNDSKSLFFKIFSTLKNFQEKSKFDKVLNLCVLPLVTILKITIPVINEDFDLTEYKHNGFILFMIQCIFTPFIIGFLNFYNDEWNYKFILIPGLISIILIGINIFMKSIIIKSSSELPFKLIKIICSFSGFIISISWISTIASELISIIKFFAILLNLSDAILGVTIFAIGNSMGDFISNFTIAKMGFPMMALSACFGGPLLNILLGIGMSGVFVIPMKGSPIELELSNTLIVGSIALLINLVFLLIVVPLNKFEMNQFTGWFMVGIWSVATLICVLLEIITA